MKKFSLIISGIAIAAITTTAITIADQKKESKSEETLQIAQHENFEPFTYNSQLEGKCGEGKNGEEKTEQKEEQKKEEKKEKEKEQEEKSEKKCGEGKCGEGKCGEGR